LNPIIFHFFLGSPIWKPRDGGSDQESLRGGGQRGAPAPAPDPPGVPPRPGSRANVGFEGDNLQAACKRTTPATHK